MRCPDVVYKIAEYSSKEISDHYTQKTPFGKTWDIPLGRARWMIGGGIAGAGFGVIRGMDQADSEGARYGTTEALQDVAIGGGIGAGSGYAVDLLRDIIGKHVSIKGVR